MITNVPHVFAGSVAPAAESSPQGFVTWCLSRIQRSVCALHGHDSLLQYERNRIYLRCTSCGYETPGWEVANDATLRRAPADVRTPLTARRDLAVARKIA